MVAIKFLGLIITFYTFIVLETCGQNFYPARYGKRDANDVYQSKDLLENRRVGRGENQDAVNRKMGFFISGGRFGKRGCSENCIDGDVNSGSKEILGEGYHIRQDRSERIRIPIRKNQFMVGSRFGKRKEGQIVRCYSDPQMLSKDLQIILNHPRIPVRYWGGSTGTTLGTTSLNNDTIENVNAQNLRCSFTSMSDLFKCLERESLNNEDDGIRFSSSSDFVQ